jgi:EAL domain-containing protein (putative c-di-GMP-specific phosphodiesterase class I)
MQNLHYLVFYDELDKFQEYENNMFWTKKLKSAFVNDNIEVYFQPLVNNETLNVDKYECLVRLIDEDGKVVLEPRFASIVELYTLLQGIKDTIKPEIIANFFTEQKITLTSNVTASALANILRGTRNLTNNNYHVTSLTDSHNNGRI